jgi:hypothetical protein
MAELAACLGRLSIYKINLSPVRVQFVFNVPNMKRTESSVTVSVPEETTAKTILDLAQAQDYCYSAT